MQSKIVAALSMLLTMLFVVNCSEDAELPKSNINGVVMDLYGDALDSVECKIKGLNITAVTKSDGMFYFGNVVVGKYSLLFARKNFVSKEVIVDLDVQPRSLEIKLNTGTEYLRINDSIFFSNYKEQSKSIKIESNTDWVISSDVSWIKQSVNTGGGNKIISINIEASSADQIRDGTVTIKSSSITRTIKVKQSFPLKLLEQTASIGNYENGIEDSITLIFNKPITITSIIANYGGCSSKMEYQVFGNKLVFAYGCARLSEEYPFTISVKDTIDSFTFQFSAKFYDDKLSVPASIQDYLITDDNLTIWAVTTTPNQILKISLPEFKIVSAYTLNFEPSKVRYNAFNNSLMILVRQETCIDCPSNYIYNFNPADERILGNQIQPIYDEDGKLLDGGRYPVDLGVMYDGLGVVLTTSIYNDYTWRYIDFAQNNAMNLSDHPLEYQGIQLSHDKHKLYLMYDNTVYIDIIESGSSQITRYNSPQEAGRPYLLVASKTIDRVFHGQLYEQFISDISNYVSNVSYLDMRSFYYGGTAFSYLPDEAEVMYYSADGFFQVLDYKNASTILTTDISAGLYFIQTTTDGKSMFGAKFGDETTDFYRFRTQNIRKHSYNQSGNSSGRVAPAKLKNVWFKN